jgi:putative aldouronate transport system substrate-binding protein
MTAPSSQITTNNMGVWQCELARMHEFDTEFSEDSGFEIWPVQDAVQNAGDTNPIRVATEIAGGGGEVIASTCKYPEIAALWLNYRYTDEGILLLNYGVEGEGFNYNENGEPELSELITGASNINFGLAMYATVFLGYSEPERMYSTYTDAQMASLDTWKLGDNEYGYPSTATMTVQESEAYNAAYSDINTYLQGEIVKFITGDRSLDEFDDYVSTVESMGIDTCIAQKQAALDRYLG